MIDPVGRLDERETTCWKERPEYGGGLNSRLKLVSYRLMGLKEWSFGNYKKKTKVVCVSRRGGIQGRISGGEKKRMLFR